MIIAFEFIYQNKNALMAYFLEYYAKKSGLKFSININENFITLFIDASEKEILKFSDTYMNFIPNSIFLAKSSVKAVEEMGENNFTNLDIKFANYTPKNIKKYHENKEIEPNEFGEISSVEIFQNGKFIKVNSENFNELLDFCALNLSHNLEILLKLDEREVKFLADVNFKDYNLLMPTNLNALEKIFICDDKSRIALATFEKPIINLKTNAIFRRNHSHAPQFFDVKIAQDLFIFALFSKLYEDEIFFVSAKVKKDEFFKISVLDDNFLIVNNPIFLPIKEREILTSSDDKTNTNFSLITKEKNKDNKKILKSFLSIEKPDILAIGTVDEKFRNIVNFNIPSPLELKEQILSDKTGEKLFSNFIAKFNYADEIFNSSNFKSPIQSGFYGIFSILSQIIFQKDAKFLLDNANDFLGPKGVRLDFGLSSDGDFRVDKLIRSAMSYRLADVDEKLLCYGCVDSLAYFLSDLFDANKDDFECILPCGMLFENKKLSNLLLKLCQKNYDIGFSHSFGLEI